MKTDICLILEGTYPYVHGGVSSWLQRIVTSLSDFTFSIVHLSSTGDVIRTPRYKIPSNILEFKEVFIHDFRDDKTKTTGSKSEGWNAVRQFYKGLEHDDFSSLDNLSGNANRGCKHHIYTSKSDRLLYPPYSVS